MSFERLPLLAAVLCLSLVPASGANAADGASWFSASPLLLAAEDHPEPGSGTDGAGKGKPHDDHAEKEGPLTIRTDLALWSLIVFVVLLVVLRAFAWGPIVTGLDSRESNIRNDIARAEADRQAAARMLAEHEARLKSVEGEIRDMRTEARTAAEQMKADAVTAGKEEAAALVEKARGEIEQERRQAEEQLKRELADMVVDAAEMVIGRKMNDGDEHRLADEALQQFAGSV